MPHPPKSGATTVVVPCYNESQRLDSSAFGQFLRDSSDVALLFVDDGSTDETPRLLEELRQQHPRQVFVLRLNTNAGKSEAVRRGIQLALRRQPAIVGYWDADLSAPLDAIARFQRVLRERPEVALVMGSRVALLGRQIHRRWLRHLLGRTFATVASIVLGLSVYDTQCGAKLVRVTPDTMELFRRPFHTRWIFDVEILARMTLASRSSDQRPPQERIYEYPLERWQDVAGSRLRWVDFLVAGWDLAAIYWRYTSRAARPRVLARPSIIHQPMPDHQNRDAA